jgi:hypothetical protein
MRAPVREIAIDTDADTHVALVEDDKTIALPQRSEKRIVLIDAAGSPARRLIRSGRFRAPWGLAADSAGKILFASYTDTDGDIYLWDLDTGKAAKLDYAAAAAGSERERQPGGHPRRALARRIGRRQLTSASTIPRAGRRDWRSRWMAANPGSSPSARMDEACHRRRRQSALRLEPG